MRARQLQELQYAPRATSSTNVLRLAGDLFSFLYPSQETSMPSSRPGLLEFLVILEYACDRNFPKELTDVTLLASLWRCATNILMWSQVIRPKEYNLIAKELKPPPGPCFIRI